MTKYQDINAKAIDKWNSEGWEWGRPITHEMFVNAQKGIWELKLTPTKFMPHEWLNGAPGKKLLGLASGGGQQMPLMTAIGFECTVLDYSDSQIKSEIVVSEREHYSIKTVQADMTRRLPFEDNSFDVIIHPVSNVYCEEVKPIFKECYRVLKKGGILICGLDNGFEYCFNDEETMVVNSLPFNPLKNPEHMKVLGDDNGIQFSHTLDEQIGGQLEAGFVLTNLYEDTNGEGHLHEMHIPTFIATRAIK